MGKRSTNTTKSGKFMNPTDRTRKEERKKELRKNKKQRMVVRAAVIKGKDPHQILADLERLDQMEYNVNCPPVLNEKVLIEKRRKLKETWDRVMRLYFKEDNEKYLELKRIEGDYEAKRSEMQKFFDAVMSTQSVALDDIPLPEAPSTEDVPLPLTVEPAPILKKAASLSVNRVKSDKLPPGPPPGPPPVLSDMEDDLEEEDRRRKKVSFGETHKKEADINEFLKEIDEVSASTSSVPTPLKAPPPLIPVLPQPLPIHPPLLAFRPPPPGPPPSGNMLRPIYPPMGVRPPGPGAMIPPPSNFNRQPPPPQNRNYGPPRPQSSFKPHPPSNAVYGGLPSSSRRDDKKTHIVSDRATIEAKPQLRNLSADATRFTPVSLRVKRNEKPQAKKPGHGVDLLAERKREESTQAAPTKDDTYANFMKEMQGFL